MNRILSTTAMIVALGYPATAFAQTTASTANPQTMQQGAEIPGFLSARGQSDLYVSELIGLEVYARQSTVDATAADTRTNTNAGGASSMATMTVADLDGMDNIGEINEIVLSNDGQVRALVIGVGGFLGMGEHDVAVTMDQVRFAADPDDGSRLYVIADVPSDRLQDSPRYERTAMGAEASPRADANADADTMAARTPFAAPDLERDGFERVAVTDVSADLLIGKTVYDVNDETVGTVDNIILGSDGTVTNVIIDFGGFLGMGSSQVSVGFDELSILSTTDRSDVRVYIDATQEQVQAQPQYAPTN